MIEPKLEKSKSPINDELTTKMKLLLKKGRSGVMYKGWHECICGERSGNCDIHVGKYITNSLAAHYLEYHREEIPESEIVKISELNA